MKKDTIRSKDYFGRIFLALSAGIVVLLYWRWLQPGVITYGDFRYLTKETLSDIFPFVWNSQWKTGAYLIFSIPLSPLLMLESLLFNLFHLNFSVLERMLVFYPFIACLIVSPLALCRVLRLNNFSTAAVILVFNLNSYMFLISGVTLMAIGAALGPLVFAAFIRILHRPGLKSAIYLALATYLQIIFDLRIFYVIFIFCILYLIYFLKVLAAGTPAGKGRIFKFLFLSLVLTVFSNSYWIIFVFFEKITRGNVSITLQGFDNPSWVISNSYSTLLHAMAIHSPFWGRFDILNGVNPHFLILTILVFSSLLLKRNQKTITFFALSSLIFSFLVKGSNHPFGFLYIWLFKYFPGFAAFRDPGKWHLPLIMSYSVMLGFLVEETGPQLASWSRRVIVQKSFLKRTFLFAAVIAAFFAVFPINPLSTMRYQGIFKLSEVPAEYERLNSFLHGQADFYRILWLPAQYRFGYSSSQHPALNAIELANGLFSGLCSGDITKWPYKFSYLNRNFTVPALRLLSVKYIIIPAAPLGNLPQFYWYELPPRFYADLIKSVGGIKNINFQGEARVYEISGSLPHFYTASKGDILMGDPDNVLPLLARTGRLNEEALVFAAAGQDFKYSDDLFKFEDYVFSDENLYDLSIDFSDPVRWTIPVFKNRVSRNRKVEIGHAGRYELWVDRSRLSPEREGSIVLDVAVDGRDHASIDILEDKIDAGRNFKYLKIADYDLKEGVRKFEIKVKDSRFGQLYDPAGIDHKQQGQGR
jgi:hypothetical protein